MAELNEDRVRLYFDRISRGLESRRPFQKEIWEECTEFASGNFSSLKDEKGTIRVVPNRAFSLAETMHALFWHQSPELYVKANEADKASWQFEYDKIWEGVIKDFWEDGLFYKEFSKMVMDAIVCGTGFIKFGVGNIGLFYPKYDKSGKLSEADKPYIEKEGLNFKELRQIYMPWVDYVPVEDLVFDPLGSELEHKRWMAHIIIKRYSDVVNDKTYTTKDMPSPAKLVGSGKSGFTAGMPNNDYLRGVSDNLNSINKYNTEDMPIILYEIYDRKENLQIVLADGYSKPLKVDDNPYKGIGTGFPVHMLRVANIRNKHYGQSLIYLIKENIIEEAELRTAVLDHIHSSKAKILLDGELSEEQRAAFESKGTLVFVPGMPRDKITTFSPPPYNPDVYRMLNDIRSDYEDILGYSRNLQGREYGQRTTATEVATIARHARNKVMVKADAVDTITQECMNTLVKLIQRDGGDIPITFNELRNGIPIKSTYKLNELLYPIDIKVIAGSSSVEYQASIKRDELNMFMINVQNPIINQVAGTRRMLQKVFELRESEINELIQQPVPQTAAPATAASGVNQAQTTPTTAPMQPM